MTPIAQAAAIAALTLGTGAATVTALNTDIPDMVVPDGAWSDSGALDGRGFSLAAEIVGSDETLTDTLLFEDGGFLSVNCEEYCAFGYSDYQTWTDGDVIHFTATAICETQPHTVVWYGQVVDDTITVEMSWTTRRWYWTHQILGIGTGTEGVETVSG